MEILQLCALPLDWFVVYSQFDFSSVVVHQSDAKSEHAITVSTWH